MKRKTGWRWLQFLAGLLFIGLLLAPLGCIYAITNLEMAQYSEVYVPAVAEKSYGAPMPALRMDMQEFITVSGSFVSAERFYMEIPKLKNTYSARLLVGIGDYIEAETLIGYTEDGTKEVFSTASGIVRDIHLGQSSYMLLESLDRLALRCFVNESVLTVFRRDTLDLTDTNGEPVELIEIGKTANQNGEVCVLLALPDGIYGAEAKGVKLYTGKVYTQALVVPTKCLFHLPEDKETWYVRVVDENRNALGNQAVQVGFSDGDYTCVSGLAEGTLLDSGYARIHGE